MLRVTKKGMTLMVSKGAYGEIYSRKGWVPLDTNSSKDSQELYKGHKAEVADNHPSMVKDSNLGPPGPSESISPQEEDLLKDMSTMELKQYASLLGLNVGKLKSREDMVQAIRKHEQENH